MASSMDDAINSRMDDDTSMGCSMATVHGPVVCAIEHATVLGSTIAPFMCTMDDSMVALMAHDHGICHEHPCHVPRKCRVCVGGPWCRPWTAPWTPAMGSSMASSMDEPMVFDLDDAMAPSMAGV